MTEPVLDQVLEDAEIGECLGGVSVKEVASLRENWIANFVGSQGVKLLMNILKDLNLIMDMQKKGEILKSKIEKDCWT